MPLCMLGSFLILVLALFYYYNVFPTSPSDRYPIFRLFRRKFSQVNPTAQF